MGYLTREQIDGARDLDAVEVEVPEWGGCVGVRPLTVCEQEEWAELAKKSPEAAGAALLAYSLVDETGAPIYDREQAAALKRRSARAVSRLTARILAINRLTDASQEELRGNS